MLSDLPALIGRSQTADVCLNDPGVAEFQCMIVQDGDTLAVIDNVEDGSTFVNGARAIWNSLMPGDNLRFTVTLISKIAMEQGLRFAIREGGHTVGAGTVAEIIK